MEEKENEDKGGKTRSADVACAYKTIMETKAWV